MNGELTPDTTTPPVDPPVPDDLVIDDWINAADPDLEPTPHGR